LRDGEPLRLNDPAVVGEEYSSERGLASRKAAYRFADGPDAREVAFRAVAEVEPRRVLEVGCGEGELAERIARELGVEVVAVDQSPRMVELTAARGVDARVGDVQELPFRDGEFDCALAAWMLYHVRDVDRGLAELARVLGPEGRLVAVTNHLDHVQELRDLLGLPPRFATPFSGANGEQLLGRHFRRIEVRDASGTVRFPDRAAVLEYVEASRVLWGSEAAIPPFDGPLVVRRRPVVFVADK
jgi:SAM-dependent methyltransferase